MLFCSFSFVCLQTLCDQSSVYLGSWKSSIKEETEIEQTSEEEKEV